jgi:disulfide bond formation protein DsbB
MTGPVLYRGADEENCRPASLQQVDEHKDEAKEEVRKTNLLGLPFYPWNMLFTVACVLPC